MYIISKFHDFYDTAIGMGIDKAVVYKRDPLDFRTEAERSPMPVERTSAGRSRYELYDAVMGFAGKLYPFVIVTTTTRGMYADTEEEPRFLYSKKAMTDFLEEIGHPLYDDKYQRQRWWNRKTTRLLTSIGQDNFFNPATHKNLEKVFLKHKVPVFLWRHGLMLNPRLQDYNFQKVKDPFSAFQEIFQYISGVLGVNENPTITLTDKDKRDKKGFDNWSFKTRPKSSSSP